jgi:hypothetical protein
MNLQAITKETMDLMRTAHDKPAALEADILRAFTQPGSATAGLIGYDLEPVAKHLFPVITPLRNKIPRDVSGFSTQANWQVISGINPNNVHMGVSEGNRGGVVGYSTYRANAAFVEYGLENWVTHKAENASKTFIDLLSEAKLQLLWSLMIQEEFNDLGGVGINGISATPLTLTSSDGGSVTGGTLTGTTYYIGVVPVTMAGYQQLAGWNMGLTGQATDITKGLLQKYTRTNVDGSTDTINGGTGIPSNVKSQSVTAGHELIVTATPLAGAVAYVWYIGTAANAMYLHSMTATSTQTFTAEAVNTNQKFSDLSATDNSIQALVYDGMLTQIMNTANGAYVQNVNGKLTSNGAAGISQLDTAFSYMWDYFRLGIDELYVSSKQLIDMNAICIANGSAPLLRYNLDATGHGTGIDVGVVITSILNPVVNKAVKIIVHPNMPAGTMLGWSNSVPYPLNDVGEIVKKKLRRDYWSIDWPMVKRRYEYGLYADGVLQCYAPFAFCVINCIQPS